jgi:hypothetical protein
MPSWVTGGIDWTTRQLATCCGPFATGVHVVLARLIWLAISLGVMGCGLLFYVRYRIEGTYGFQVWSHYPGTYVMREMTTDSERRIKLVGEVLLVVVLVYFFLFTLSALVVRAQVQSCAA